MSKTTFCHSPATLDEKLTAYWALVDEQEMNETRIEKARAEKDTVNERIFRKVVTDYEESLESVVARLKPLKQEIDELRRSVNEEIKQVDSAIQDLEDEIAEAGFRHLVGEFDDEQFNTLNSNLTPSVDETKARREELRGCLEVMDRRRSPSPEGHNKSVDKQSPPEPAQQKTDNVSTPALENPQTWADELEPVELDMASLIPETHTASPVAATPCVESANDDPLAALSDPAPGNESAPAPSAAAPAVQSEPFDRATTVAPAYPNLVIRTGVHAGKIVPLLPMTMSIGREHDNVIELKDPDVARYHARVLYENGRFFVEDLDSSTGTWVNDVREKKHSLDDGDVIRIGGTELAFEL